MAVVNLSRHRVTATTEFSDRTWNQLVDDLGVILDLLMNKTASFDAATAQLVQAGLIYIQGALAPAFERLQEYQAGGFLDAPLVGEVSFADGPLLVTVHPDNAEFFTPSAFVALTRADSTDDYAIAQRSDYSKTTGILSLLVLSHVGTVGPFTDVSVSALAGSVLANGAFVVAGEAARDLARDWSQKPAGQDVTTVGTRSALHYAAAAATQAGLSSTYATASTGQASVATVQAGIATGQAAAAALSAIAAAASAIAAATFNPADYFTKLDLATAADIRGAVGDKVITPAAIDDASEWVPLEDASPIPLPWGDFLGGEVIVTANRVFGNPTGVQPGSTRYVLVKGFDGTPRSVTFGTNFEGQLPSITGVTESTWYLVSMVAIAADHITATAQLAKSP